MISPLIITVRNFDRSLTGYDELIPMTVMLGDFPIIRYSILYLEVPWISLSAHAIMYHLAKFRIKNSIKVHAHAIMKMIGRFKITLSIKANASSTQLWKAYSSNNRFSIKAYGNQNVKTLLRSKFAIQNEIHAHIDPSKYGIGIFYTLGHWDGVNDDITLGDLDNMSLGDLDYQET